MSETCVLLLLTLSRLLNSQIKFPDQEGGRQIWPLHLLWAISNLLQGAQSSWKQMWWNGWGQNHNQRVHRKVCWLWAGVPHTLAHKRAQGGRGRLLWSKTVSQLWEAVKQGTIHIWCPQKKLIFGFLDRLSHLEIGIFTGITGKFPVKLFYQFTSKI